MMAAGITATTKLVLRDIHMSPAPSWWPPAPGWWLLATGGLLLFGSGVFLGLRYLRHRRVCKRILAAVANLEASQMDDERLACQLHQWLRRSARHYEDRAIRQRGDAWRQTLARVQVKNATIDTLMLLEQRIYQPLTPFDRNAALTATRLWLRAAWQRRLRRQKVSRHA